MSKKRLPANERRDHILNAAVELAKSEGYNRITRDAVVQAAEVSAGLLNLHFKTMKQFRRALMRHAVTNEVVEIVAQGLANRDDHARKAPDDLKQRAMEYMLAQS